MGAASLIAPESAGRVGPGMHPNGADVLIAHQPIVGMLQDDFERMITELLAPRSSSASPLDDLQAVRPAPAGVRHYLSESEGGGYWDFYRPQRGLVVSVTDATYRNDAWVRVEGSGYFKLRILLSGVLRARSGETIARGPEALLYVSPGASREGYYIASGEHLRMIVLHCRPDLLSRALGLGLLDVPPPLNTLFSPSRAPARLRLAPSPEIIHVARRILESRHELSRALRERLLETLSIELILQVLGMLEKRALVRQTTPVSARELSRVHEARDYLAQHYAHPPTIPDLARMVGLNQTKLKATFREIFRSTIYEYILERRMDRAAEMLLSGDHAIAQVAYAVGYDYPANFAAAFKRHFGQLPRTWKQGRLGH
jgi:AraC-like DNA-binding protein